MWYTGAGDGGRTKVPSAGELWKDDALVQALGDLDELNSVLGLAASIYPRLRSFLLPIQSEILAISSELAGFPLGFGEDRVTRLELTLKKFADEVPELKNFVLPGGNIGASTLHLARSVCRRAERSLVRVTREGSLQGVYVKYLNRLSSLLFVMALWVNLKEGVDEVMWSGSSWKKGIREDSRS
ncbi:ATP:cob(I)alamin adenosyltransferase [Sulfodiicoccus acidiphilus]|uniref:ATP:cob(I)alamin adenosyltransferase n=1 Tax=Sulfodiicoccus acidiphilus TaxID=1670455 RepID=A0A348B2X2_9CREN|nr:cob(I)yrinic acid a,c-diamide adenosyltransferase [Sulfodiicoccus acidiphilus]BBD72524.1 ATP:cob(I)alamin adenosyltransferase [Sulfodiicoccus acidiphilus]GGT93925.1 ATP:cob(I)alamin adenosyltransferase [Sulfodiicoccus acidiphilus]